MKDLLKKLKEENIAIAVKDNDLIVKFNGKILPEGIVDEIKSRKADLITYLSVLKESALEKQVTKASVKDSYVLSSAQKRLWILSQLSGGNEAYNISGAYKLIGDLNNEAFYYAFMQVIDRHEILRTSFKEDYSGEIRQFIYTPEESDFKIDYVDLSIVEDNEKEAAGLVESISNKSFDLERGALLRTSIIKISESERLLVYSIHHIVSDAWSIEILMNEVFAFYNSYVNGKRFELDELNFQYKDYAELEYSNLNDHTDTKLKDYWLNQLGGELPVLNLCGSKKRPNIKTYNGKYLNTELGNDILNDLKEFCRDNGGSLFMGLVSGLNALIYRYTNQSDQVIGTPIAGRNHQHYENQIGLYAGNLALRTRFDGNDSFTKLFGNVKQVCFDSYENGNYTYDNIIEDLKLKRDMSRNPLYDVMIMLNNTDVIHKLNTNHEEGSLLIVGYDGGEHKVSRLDLTLNLFENTDSITLNVEYNTDVFEDQFIKNLIDHYKKLIKQALQYPDLPISELDILSKKEKEFLLNEININIDPNAEKANLVELFEKQVNISPESCSVRFKDETFSLGQVSRYSNQIARYLIQEYQIQLEDLVGVKIPRDPWMVFILMGILKAGAGYVPIDTEYPLERVDYILNDSKCKILIDDAFLKKLIADINEYDSSSLSLNIPSNNIAYVIYTSGSTGRPKGVLVEHGNVVSFLENSQKTFSLGEGTIFAGITNYTFDISVFEIIGSLVKGFELFLIPDFDPGSLANALSEKHFNTLQITPSRLGQLFDSTEGLSQYLDKLNVLIIGGEEMGALLFDKLKQLKNVKVFNVYGPTETTVWSSFVEIHGIEEVNIGKPLINENIYVIDTSGNLVPVGVAGEICISGLGVTRGYLNNPELTAVRFVEKQFGEAGIMYRTGDLGRWLPDGNLEYIGRNDEQVKISGYRIELKEIESVIDSFLGNDSSAVLTESNPDYGKSLVAYITNTNGKSVKDIRAHLGDFLPYYMLPARYVQVESFPLNYSGKLDRKALSNMDGTTLDSGSEYLEPTTETEHVLVAAFSSVLSIDRVGIRDNFFYLGGDSRKSIQLSGKIKSLGYFVSIQDIINNPVIENLALKTTLINRIPDQGSVTGVVPLGPVQSSFLESKFGTKNHYNLSVLLHKQGGVDLKGLLDVINKLVIHHDILRAVFYNDNDVWIQEIKSFEEILKIDQLNYANENEFLRICDEVQASINLEKGPLFKIVLLKSEIEGDSVLFLSHHLVMDHLSSQILLEDFNNLYQQFVQGINLSLPLKSESYKYFQQKQLEISNSDLVLNELAYWKGIQSIQVDPIWKDVINGSNLAEDSSNYKLVLDRSFVEFLTSDAFYSTGCSAEDFVLAGLCTAIKEFFGVSKSLVMRENGGRRLYDLNIDVTRTIGWFTTIYPVLFDISEVEDIMNQMDIVKEAIKTTPNEGIGYGILNNILKKEIKPAHSDVLFTYVGDVQTGLVHENNQKSFVSVDKYHGLQQPRKKPRGINLNVSSMIVNERLVLAIEYSGKQYKKQTIKDFLATWNKMLLNLSNLTKTHYHLKNLTVNTTVQKHLANQNIYDLSYNQSFYLHEWNDHVTESVILRQNFKEISLFSLEKALKVLIERFEILRTIYVNSEGKLKQKILSVKEFDFKLPEVIHLDSTEDISKIIENEYGKKIEILNTKLFSVIFYTFSDGSFTILLKAHHSITDGFSAGILQHDLSILYELALKNEPLVLKPLQFQYKDFSTWQQQFLSSLQAEMHKKYWLKKLEGCQTNLNFPATTEAEQNDFFSISSPTVISGKLYKDIYTFALQNNITRGSLLLSGFYLLLHHLTKDSDITVGVNDSGRHSKYFGDLEIKDQIGCFANILLVRNQVNLDIPPMDFLRRIQNDFFEDLNYNDYPFTKLVEELPSIELSPEFINYLIFFNYQNFDFIKELVADTPSDDAAPLEYVVPVKCNFGLYIYEYQNGFKFDFMFNPNNFNKERRIEIINLYGQILEKIISKSVTSLHEIF